MQESGEDIVGNGYHFVEEITEDTKDGKDNKKVKDEGDALGNTRPTYGQVIARMPTEKYASHYKMDHKFRGKALIFNHKMFCVANLKPRAGTDEDRDNLNSTLHQFGFQVETFQDLKYDEIMHHVNRVSKMDHSHFDCMLICILSHGENGIIYAKDTPYKPEYLWTHFTADHCPTLAGKPKMFFFQACQGDKLDGGVILAKTETDGRLVHSYKIPSQADFLIVYSTVKGYYSWRNTTKGSWFVQALCEELRTKGTTHDLMTILTFVSQRVAIDFESNCPDNALMHQQKQIPCIMSMLTRLIQLNKKEN